MSETRHTHWHQLGTDTRDCMTSSEAMEKANLDWEVELEKMYFNSGDTYSPDFTRVPEKFAVVKDREDCLGVVGSRYNPVQNSEAFRFMDNIVDSSEAIYDSAGSFNGGRTIWILMKVNKALNVNDVIEPHMLLINTHDGSGALKVVMTPVRVSCQNTLRLAIAKANNVFSVRHTSSINGKIDEARNVLGIADKFFDEFSLEVNQLIEKEITNEQFEKIYLGAIPRPTLRKTTQGDYDDNDEKSYQRKLKGWEKNKRFITQLYLSERNTGDAWGVLNAFNSYEIWNHNARTLQSSHKRLEQKAKKIIYTDDSLTNKVKGILENV